MGNDCFIDSACWIALWSLTYCISIAVMKKNGIHEAFSSDEHFSQAGFTILIRK